MSARVRERKAEKERERVDAPGFGVYIATFVSFAFAVLFCWGLVSPLVYRPSDQTLSNQVRHDERERETGVTCSVRQHVGRICFLEFPFGATAMVTQGVGGSLFLSGRLE